MWPALAVLALDQITKHLIASRFPLYETQPLISGFFNLVHVRNRGMAFGIMNRPGADWGFILLLCATLGAVALLLFWFYRLKSEDKGHGHPSFPDPGRSDREPSGSDATWRSDRFSRFLHRPLPLARFQCGGFRDHRGYALAGRESPLLPCFQGEEGLEARCFLI